MATATITSKGQITIPAAVREELHVSTGDRVEFVRVAEGRYEFVAATQDVSQLRGMIKADKAISVEAMNKAVKAKAGS